MTESEKQEFAQMLAKQLPELEVEDFSTRNVNEVYQFLVFVSTIGLFSGLWKVIEFWVQQRSIATIKVSYTSQDGQKVDVEYTNLTKREAEKYLANHPPKVESPIKIEIPKQW